MNDFAPIAKCWQAVLTNKIEPKLFWIVLNWSWVNKHNKSEVDVFWRNKDKYIEVTN